MNTNFMPIGRFSKSCRLTIKALRHYDSIGLLKPAHVDPSSGYRYYSPDQARDAVMIGMLRSLDISIPVIKQLLNSYDNEFKTLLSNEQTKIQSELEKKQRILKSLQHLYEQPEIYPYNVAIREEPTYTVAKLNCSTSAETMLEDSTILVYQLFAELQQLNRDYEDPVMCINEDPDKHEKIIVHACIGISEPFPELASAHIAEIPGGPAAWLTHKGSYEQLGLAYHGLFSWIQVHGYEQRDAMREIYKNDPSETAQVDLITEVILPIKTR